MKVVLLFGIVLFVWSCSTRPDPPQKLDFRSFSLLAPTNWKKITLEGIDSYVGGLTNGKDSLIFDFGRYSAEITDEEKGNHLYAGDTVNGLYAIIPIPKNAGSGRIAIYFPKVRGEDKFNLMGWNIASTDSVLQIFKSIRFKNSDTTKNSQLTRVDFGDFPYDRGRDLFKELCTPCHGINKIIGALDMKTALSGEDADSILKFLQTKSTIKIKGAVINDQHRNLSWFNGLGKKDMEAIIKYVGRN